jgi:hypothetical protein
MGTGITEMAPGTQKGVQIVVADAEAARAQLLAQGVQASEVDVQPWGSFVTFSDPDGNGWILQEVTTRFPGRVAGDTTYTSAGDLSQALRRAAAAHGEHEARTGEADANWPDWYAEYMVREQAGQELPL